MLVEESVVNNLLIKNLTNITLILHNTISTPVVQL